jgi:hypothetical protein
LTLEAAFNKITAKPAVPYGVTVAGIKKTYKEKSE